MKYEMSEIINKFLLTGDKFMPEMHLRQSVFTYSACAPFTKNKERIKKFKEAGDSRYIYPNKLDKTCFQHDMAYGDFRDLNRRTDDDKVLRDKAFNIAKNSKYDGCQPRLASIVYNFFDKRTSDRTSTLARSETLATRIKSAIENEIISNKELAEELHKQIIKKFEKRKVHSPFIDYIWGADLADMQFISNFNKDFCYVLLILIANMHVLFL